MTNRIEGIARQLAEARRSGARIALDDPPRDIDESFAVQDRVIELLGEPIIGWKANQMPDGRVLSAPLLASGIVPAGGTWKVTGNEPAGIELEIAFRMARDVPAGASRTEVLDSIGDAMVVFELCQSRIAAPESTPRHVSLADCISNFGVIVGASFEGWRDRDLKAVPGRLIVDGKVHGEGKSADPIHIMSILPAGLAPRGKALRKGDIVITGSLIGMHWLTGHHALLGEIDGCGSVTARLEASD